MASLYITGLPAQITDEQVKAVFSQYGTVGTAKALDQLPGAVDKNALVEMQSMDQANWLVQNLNGNIPACLQTPVTVQFLNPGGATAAPTMGAMTMGGGGGMGMMGGGGGGGEAKVNGTVKRWDTAKGFGFLIPEGGGPDVFVHARELQDGDCLMEGATVQFVIEQDAKAGNGKLRARNCTGAVPKDSAPAPAGPVAQDNLFIAGLPLEITEEQIQATFSQYGTVVGTKKLPVQPGKPDCACLVRMSTVDQAQWLVDNVNQNIPNGLTTKCTIRFADSKGKGSGKGGDKGGDKGFGGGGGFGGKGGGGGWGPSAQPAGMMNGGGNTLGLAIPQLGAGAAPPGPYGAASAMPAAMPQDFSQNNNSWQPQGQPQAQNDNSWQQQGQAPPQGQPQGQPDPMGAFNAETPNNAQQQPPAWTGGGDSNNNSGSWDNNSAGNGGGNAGGGGNDWQPSGNSKWS